MKRLALTLVLFGLVISGTAAADPTCKAKAIKQKLVGEALISFVKKCETDAYLACAERATREKLTGPASDRFIDTCATKAMGTGLMVRTTLLSEQFRLHGRRRVRCLLGRPLRKVSWPRPKPDSHSVSHLPSKLGSFAIFAGDPSRLILSQQICHLCRVLCLTRRFRVIALLPVISSSISSSSARPAPGMRKTNRFSRSLTKSFVVRETRQTPKRPQTRRSIPWLLLVWLDAPRYQSDHPRAACRRFQAPLVRSRKAPVLTNFFAMSSSVALKAAMPQAH